MFNDFRKRTPAKESVSTNVVPLKPEPVSALHEPDAALMAHLELKSRLHRELLDRLNLSMIDKVEKAELRRQIAAFVSQYLAQQATPLRADAQSTLIDELIFEVMGLGPLEPLLADPTINDILVNTHEQVYVERNGKLEKSNVRFHDERHLLRIIDKIVSSIGRRIDESQPWVDARLADGSRVNAIIRPCAVDGPSLSIRKFSRNPLTMERLVAHGSLTDSAAAFLRALVEARLNVLISGGTGSGKTTMLNAMSSYISPDHRIVTIEDAAELQMQQDHVVRLETRPANVEGKAAVSQRDLVRNALRMRPDRIIVGEVRGSECFDMLQAMNTGHDGSMTTVHANSARDALSRVEQMVTMLGADLPLRTIRSQIAAGFHVVVQLSRMSDGRRRLISISEITGMEQDVITMQDLFKFRRDGVNEQGDVLGEFVATGIRPRCTDLLQAAGIHLDPETFHIDRVKA
ncbi:CpaF family protein [Actibacterium sp. XHP0104]|uniref:CpaF family protein n=1 Tax=Actibacterium sp. XHP0104 TaxID=2984335 RepID=UPI0021E92645|nr:CpaF family protein [Actibacterium sp. XHP0104]MCV2882973.1 CpaF family protein [Actibacterium sp. XHP0104]